MKRKEPILLLPCLAAWLFLCTTICACHGSPSEEMELDAEGAETLPLTLTSPAFSDGTPIPKRHTRDGEDRSPSMEIGTPPQGTVSLALVCDDPDAPAGTWIHWVIFNLPPGTRLIEEGVPQSETLPNGARQGRNDFGKIGYNGPAPPPGPAHRYFFKVYALDTVLDLPPGISQARLSKAMKGHVLAKGELVGTYER